MRPPRSSRRWFHLDRFGRRLEESLEEELLFHLQGRTEELIRTGLSPEEAEARVRAESGDLERLRDLCLRQNRRGALLRKGRGLLGSLWFESRLAARSFLRNPGFTAAALLSLTVGIGANLAVFSLLYTVLVQPLPYPEADRLVLIGGQIEPAGSGPLPVSLPDVADLAGGTRTLSGLAGFWYTDFTCSGQGEPEKLKGCMVSASFTDVLAVRPLIGRGFRPEDETPEATDVVLIGEGLWRRRWGGRPDILGTSVHFAGQPFTIVGVLPAAFRFPEQAEVWTPIWSSLREYSEMLRGSRDFYALGRMKEGVTVAESRRDLRMIAEQLAGRFPESHGDVGVYVTPLRNWVFGDMRRQVLILYTVVCLVLLLACANVANLLLARNTTRRSEIGIRAALGAGHARMAGQFLIENLLLALMGGCSGAALGWAGRTTLLRLAPIDFPPHLDFSLSSSAVLLITGIVIGTGLLFGFLPAAAAIRPDIRNLLAPDGPGRSESRSRNRWHSGLVSFQAALALIVLIGALLMTKSLHLHAAVEPGFQPEDRVSLFVTVPGAPDLIGLHRALIEQVEAIPGISQVSTVTELPTGFIDTSVQGCPEDDLSSSPDLLPRYPLQICDRRYFQTMGIPVLRGRSFGEEDEPPGALAVVIINEAFAQRYWPEADPIGKYLRLDLATHPEKRWKIIGVVADTPNRGWGRPVEPAVHLLFDQAPVWDTYLVARTDREPGAALAEIRQVIRTSFPQLPLSLFRPLERAVLEANWQIHLYAWLFVLFSFITTVLAATGISGVMAYTVTQRLREYGIRMAMGVSPAQIVGLVLRRGFRLHFTGIAIGIALALLASRLLTGLLFQVEPFDPAIYAGAVLGLTVVAGPACLIPVLRIARLSPAALLHHG